MSLPPLQELGSHLAPRSLRSADGSVSLRTLRSAGRRAIALYGGADYAGVAADAAAAGCWPRTVREIVSPWPRAPCLEMLAPRLAALEAAHARTRGFLVLQAVVTPSPRLVAAGLLRRPSRRAAQASRALRAG